MSDQINIARKYLLPPAESFWDWCDGGETIAWIDGKTITFRGELAQIIKHLAPGGLPPLGALLLLLAATRESWKLPPDDLSTIAGWLSNTESARENVNALYVVMEQLDKVHALESDLRSTPEAKSILAEIVFENITERTSAEDAAVIAQAVENRLGELLELPEARPTSATARGENWLLAVLYCLQRGLDGLTAERLRLRRETGLDSLPQPAELELPLAQRVRSLLTSLEHDDELCGLAKLAHDLMAAVSLPRAVIDHEELQVGGVSDITNRGTLDRLLLSELAHDDFALAGRVAMNEALYLRREAPPRTPPRQRAILLESGIRSWGVPRMFATAVAMALAATSDQRFDLSVYRARQGGIAPVDLTTREGLTDHLSALDPDLHPGAALDAFEKELADADAAEPLLVVSEDVFEDEEFQTALSRRKISDWHLATVNREGRFRLMEWTLRGTRLFRESVLNLDELCTEPRPGGPRLIDREWARDLPAIFSVEPFPLLLSHNAEPQLMWTVPGKGVLSVTKDRRLMLWTAKDRGAQQISDRIPRGNLWWSTGDVWESTVQAVVGYREGLSLLTIDLERFECKVQRLELDIGPTSICSHNEMLFAIYSDRVQLVSRYSGALVQTEKLPRFCRWMSGRYFRDDSMGEWFAVTFNGRTAHFERVLCERREGIPVILRLFDRHGIDGPVGLTNNFDLFYAATHKIEKIGYRRVHHNKVRRISPDGRYITIDSQSSTHGEPSTTVVIDLQKPTWRAFGYRANNALLWEFRDHVRPVNMRHRFTQIYVNQQGLLTLVSRKRQFYCIENMSGQIVLRRNTDAAIRRHGLSFEEIKIRSDVGYRLSKATWSDGSAAFLDSRGLLHLKSSDKSLPEVSLTLLDGRLAGWCSRGQIFGNPYFIGNRHKASDLSVFKTAIRPFCERLR